MKGLLGCIEGVLTMAHMSAEYVEDSVAAWTFQCASCIGFVMFLNLGQYQNYERGQPWNYVGSSR